MGKRKRPGIELSPQSRILLFLKRERLGSIKFGLAVAVCIKGRSK